MAMRFLVLVLLLLAAPASATQEGSCAATAKELDQAFYQADVLAYNGRLSAAAQTRSAYQRGVDIFIYTCLKPRVCPAYFQKFQHWFPPEYSTKTDFTGFRDAWEVAVTTGCQ